MTKRKTVRFQFTAPGVIDAYVQRLLERGTFGDTRTEVVRRLVCNGLMEALSGETIQRICQQYHDREAIEGAKATHTEDE